LGLQDEFDAYFYLLSSLRSVDLLAITAPSGPRQCGPRTLVTSR